MTATTSEDLTVDSVSLKTYAKNIDTLAATLRVPGKRGANTVVANRDGSIWTPWKAAEEGEIILPMWVLGCDDDGNIPGGSNSRKEFYKRVDELTRLFSKDYALLDVRHTLPDATIRRVLAEVTATYNFTTQQDPFGLFTVVMNAPESFWKDVVATNNFVNVAVAGSNTPDLTWATGGTAPINDATYTILGPATNPRIVDLVSGCYINYQAVVPAAQSLIYNADTFVISGAGGFNPDMSKVTYWKTGGRLMRMVPNNLGEYKIRLQATATTVATRLTAVGYKKYQVG